MLRLRYLSNVYQKRLVRPMYAQTQATPYAAFLDSSVVTPDLVSFNSTYTFPGALFLYQSGAVPGTVMSKGVGENVLFATGGAPATGPTGDATQPLQAFGLLANFVGGNLDELFGANNVGVWRGPDSVYEILAPGFNPAGLSAAYAAATTAGLPVYLYAGADSRLCCDGSGSPFAGSAGNRQIVAQLVDMPATDRIIIDLKV